MVNFSELNFSLKQTEKTTKSKKLMVEISSSHSLSKRPEAEFKEFEQRLKFEPRLKYGWLHLNLY